MSILIMLFRKMSKNRWLVLSLLAGMILCTSVASSIPTYTNATLQRMLVKEMDDAFITSRNHPGRLIANFNYASTNLEQNRYKAMEAFIDSYWEQGPLQAEGLTPLMYYKEMSTYGMHLEPLNPTLVNPQINRRVALISRTNLLEHVRLVDGRFPSDKPVDGVYEVLVTDNTLVRLDMVLGNVFVVSEDNRNVDPGLQFKPVGVVTQLDNEDLYWNYRSISFFNNQFIIDSKLYESELLEKARLYTSNRYITYDYSEFNLNKADQLLQVFQDTKSFYGTYFSSISSNVQLPLERTLESYYEKEKTIRSLLMSLNVPLYILMGFYLYVVSNLIVTRQKPEIAVLRSRGAGRLQLMTILAMEALFLSVLAFLVGPWVGQWFTKILGSTSTFMSFVQRKALIVDLTYESFLYAGLAAIGAAILIILPMIKATRFSIVDQKKQSTRQAKGSFWHTLGLDFIFLALSIYGLFTFRGRLQELLDLGLESGDLRIDPLLFTVPSLFMLGLGLFLLRIYPWVIRFVYWIGQKFWPPSLYSTLLLVGRRNNQYHALMIFILLTIGTGLFSASAARTLNDNMEDQIWYAQGGDIVIQQRWVDDAPPVGPDMPPPNPNKAINYLEPSFQVLQDLPGVEAAARVFRKNDAQGWYGSESSRVTLMGIDTVDFGETAWMKEGLLPYHMNDYLNLIASDPYSALISQSMADQWEVEIGDTIYVGWSQAGRMPLTVFGIVDYFPGFNPNTVISRGSESKPMLVVTHLPTIQAVLRVEPYQVWMKLTDRSVRQELFDSFGDQRISLISLTDSYEKIMESQNEPFRMAMNGMMSLGFILSLCISFMGFLLYWVLSLQGRIVQLGVFRAMGISFRQLIQMLTFEQLLTSGAAFVIGLISGSIASYLFVPMFQLSFNPDQVVPPFEVIIRMADTTNLILLMILMLGAAVVFLSWLIGRMKIHQAVKLGED